MRRPSPSFFISVAALVVATSGTSYAAMTIGSSDIKDDSIRSQDVKDGTLKSKDFRRSQLPRGERGPAGTVGPRGPEGAGRWLLVDAAGEIVAQSGGFEIVAGYPTLPNTTPYPGDNSLRANGNVYINANEDLSDNGFVATIALQNTVDQNGDAITSGRAPGADANPEFSGEIAASHCNFVGATIPTNCAPPGAQNATSFVVSPRNSDGSVTGTDTRKRFYVVLTGDSSDYVAPTTG